MEKTKIQNPHDKLFRASMQYSEVARDFLTTHLPEHLKSKIDFTSLKTCPESFIDEDFLPSMFFYFLKKKLLNRLIQAFIVLFVMNFCQKNGEDVLSRASLVIGGILVAGNQATITMTLLCNPTSSSF